MILLDQSGCLQVKRIVGQTLVQSYCVATQGYSILEIGRPVSEDCSQLNLLVRTERGVSLVQVTQCPETCSQEREISFSSQEVYLLQNSMRGLVSLLTKQNKLIILE